MVNKGFYTSIVDQEAEPVTNVVNKKPTHNGVNIREMRLNPSTSRQAMILYEIFGPAVSKRKRKFR